MLNIGSSSTGAKVLAAKHDLAKLELTSPVCTKKGEKVKKSPHLQHLCYFVSHQLNKSYFVTHLNFFVFSNHE